MIKKIPYLSSKTFFLVASLISVMIVIVGVTSTNQYTFFSRADEGLENVEFVQSAIVPETVDEATRPSCVKHIEYLNGSDQICFVQYECVDSLSHAPEGCSLESTALVTCDVPNSCKTIGEWIAEARNTCGC